MDAKTQASHRALPWHHRAQCGHTCAGVERGGWRWCTDAGGENDRKLIAPAVAAYITLYGRPRAWRQRKASREAGNAPNSVLAAAAAIVGPKRQLAAREALKFMIERFHAAELGTPSSAPA
jgi:hypothetical protein